MVKTIDMQDMRYLNLFSRITKVTTRLCFPYNEAIIFCVPRNLVSRAVGEGGRNVKELNRVLRKKIKIIAAPLGIADAKRFVEDIVSPVTFKGLDVNENEIILTAGSQSKAALIGRNKRRLLELQDICSGFFEKDVRIV